MNVSPPAPSRALLRSLLIFILLTGLTGLASAKPWWMRGIESNENDFLPPDVAFRVAARVDGSLLRVHWVIADGYYLYRHKMEIKAESPDLVVAAPAFPAGVRMSDAYLGAQEVYFQQVEATVPYSRIDAGAHPLQIKVTYQGCATAGLCYPPITKVIFPQSTMLQVQPPSHPWIGIAIIGGGLAFLMAGLLLRKGRELDIPTL
jgi:thiol:disulfide interchange protein DsbD